MQQHRGGERVGVGRARDADRLVELEGGADDAGEEVGERRADARRVSASWSRENTAWRSVSGSHGTTVMSNPAVEDGLRGLGVDVEVVLGGRA